MKCKYKKFLKAAYIDYGEDYCGYGSGVFTKPVVTTPIIVITGTTAIIACAISGVTIYYTLDGSTPTSSSTEYTGTITLTLSCTIKAIAVKPGLTDSAVASESYIHYLTQWKIVGNSQVHTDPYLTSWKVSGNSVVDNNTILSCGDLGQDGKYHILVQPQGGSIADIALDAPLRKVNNVADSIEFPSENNGKALVTRNLFSILIRNAALMAGSTNITDVKRILLGISNAKPTTSNNTVGNILCSGFETKTGAYTYNAYKGISVDTGGNIQIYDPDYNTTSDFNDFKTAYADTEVIYELVTPTTELVDAPQIAEADSYSCKISQGDKAVEWSSFSGGILHFYDKIIPTGNAYIDIGYIPSINSKFVTHIKRESLNYGCLYSNASLGKTDGIRFLFSGNRYYVSFGSSRVQTEPNTNLDLTITHAHTEYLIINGNDNTYKTSVGNNYIAQPLTIFSDYYNRATSGTMSYFNGNSLYSFKIYENDVLVRDFKPCTYNGVVGLWDMVESKFYGNSNSVGTLTTSNDV